MYEGRMPWLMWLFRRTAVYVKIWMSVLVCTGQEEQGMNGKLVPPKDSAEALLVRDICDQSAKSTYILFHMYRYQQSINNKDNGRETRPNFIIIWQMKTTKLNLFSLESNSRLSPGSYQGTTQPWNKTKKLYQVSATLCFIKQFQLGTVFGRNPTRFSQLFFLRPFFSCHAFGFHFKDWRCLSPLWGQLE